MEKRPNLEEEKLDPLGPNEPPRRTIRSWEELAANIKAGHEITLTYSHKGVVIKTYYFNDDDAVHDVEVVAPEAAPEARNVATGVSSERTSEVAVRSFTLGQVIGAVIYVAAGAFAALFWVLPAIAFIVPVLLVMSIMSFVYTMAEKVLTRGR